MERDSCNQQLAPWSHIKSPILFDLGHPLLITPLSVSSSDHSISYKIMAVSPP